MWNASKSTAVPRLGASANGCNPLLGAHYFVTSPSGTGLSPVWDFRGASAKGNPNAFVLAAKVGDLPAPTGSQDVDWLQLKNVTGELATSIYRVNTKGGQPPASVRFPGFVACRMVLIWFCSVYGWLSAYFCEIYVQVL